VSRAVLYCRSEYFARLLTQDPSTTKIDITDAAYVLVYHLLYYLYSDTFTSGTCSETISLTHSLVFITSTSSSDISTSIYRDFIDVCEKYAAEHIERIFKILIMSNDNTNSLMSAHLSKVKLSVNQGYTGRTNPHFAAGKLSSLLGRGFHRFR